MSLGSKEFPRYPSVNSDVFGLIEREFGEEALRAWDNMPPLQRADLYRRAKESKNWRLESSWKQVKSCFLQQITAIRVQSGQIGGYSLREVAQFGDTDKIRVTYDLCSRPLNPAEPHFGLHIQWCSKVEIILWWICKGNAPPQGKAQYISEIIPPFGSKRVRFQGSGKSDPEVDVRGLCLTILASAFQIKSLPSAHLGYNDPAPQEPGNVLFIDRRTMGPVFKDINGPILYAPHSTLTNSPLVNGSYQKLSAEGHKKAADAIARIQQEIERVGSDNAGELFNAFNEELQMPSPKKTRLAAFWKGLTDAAPTILKLPDVVLNIQKLFEPFS